MSEQTTGIVVIGAGAAGLMAGIFAGRRLRELGSGERVILLDGAARIGAKILISGGGRCNVTHDVVRAEDFNGSTRPAIAKVLRSFDVASTVDFFESLDVRLKREETGKLFPVTDRAISVIDALLDAISSAGCEIVTGAKVSEITRSGEDYEVKSSAGSYRARRIILAAGGRSVPKTGSDGSGFELAKALGHSIVEPFPALVPLVFNRDHWLTQLSGITVPVTLSVETENGRVLERISGSAVLTHFGISGPAPLDISRHWILAHRDDRSVRVVANFSGIEMNALDAELVRAGAERPHAHVASHFALPDRLVSSLLENEAGVPRDTPFVRLTRDERKRIAKAFTSFVLPVTGNRGFDYAEATAGGVPLAELSLATMESRKSAGAYLCGEVLDVDGRIGGYNFQWAWSSGRLAGDSAARSLSPER